MPSSGLSVPYIVPGSARGNAGEMGEAQRNRRGNVGETQGRCRGNAGEAQGSARGNAGETDVAQSATQQLLVVESLLRSCKLQAHP